MLITIIADFKFICISMYNACGSAHSVNHQLGAGGSAQVTLDAVDVYRILRGVAALLNQIEVERGAIYLKLIFYAGVHVKHADHIAGCICRCRPSDGIAAGSSANGIYRQIHTGKFVKQRCGFAVIRSGYHYFVYALYVLIVIQRVCAGNGICRNGCAVYGNFYNDVLRKGRIKEVVYNVYFSVIIICLYFTFEEFFNRFGQDNFSFYGISSFAKSDDHFNGVSAHYGIICVYGDIIAACNTVEGLPRVGHGSDGNANGSAVVSHGDFAYFAHRIHEYEFIHNIRYGFAGHSYGYFIRPFARAQTFGSVVHARAYLNGLTYGSQHLLRKTFNIN